MAKTRWSAYVMAGSILVILLFQGYWLHRLYKEEQLRTQQQADVLFRDLVYKMQVQRFKADTLIYNAIKASNVFGLEAANAIISARKKVPSEEFKKKVDPRASFLESVSDSLIRVIQVRNATDTAPRVIKIFFDSSGMRDGKIKSMHFFSNKKMEAVGGIDSLIANETKNSVGTKPPISIKFKQSVEINDPQHDSISSKKLLVKSNKGTSISMVMRTKPIADSLAIRTLDSAYKKELHRANVELKYHILTGKLDSAINLKDADSVSFSTNIASVGLADPRYYKAIFTHASTHIIMRILPQALFSIVLTLSILFAFIFLYRNIVSAEKMAELKNDFISNITHELKTPVATVQVAVEALKNFDAIKNPEKTKDYLDIATVELQRLGLLVDKVLRISMFQKQGFILNREKLDFKLLIEENLNIMKLQFEKYGATVSFMAEEHDYMMDGDKLHLLSIVYNLLDNALKYSAANPQITLQLKKPALGVIQLEVEDKGIGIPDRYLSKVFERFFRVPTKDRHDVKGYGLGLSYVQHIIKEHGGFIAVKSKEGVGSTFTVSLPSKTSAS
jgi:two-component system, OmpR family, phosphate regulon sensor histidine kinase PhoR